MMSPAPFEYLRSHPGASRKQVMKACGCSARAVRQAEDQLEREGIRRSGSRGRLLAAALGFSVFAGGFYLALREEATSSPAAPHASGLSPEELAAESALYAALDQRDPARAQEATRQLQSDQPALRLAALRYLASLDAAEHLDLLLPLLDDSSPRVRVATLRSLGSGLHLPEAQNRELGQRLTAIVLDAERPLPERVVASQSLDAERLPEPQVLLPALDDPRLASHVDQALARLTGKRVRATPADDLSAAWRRALQVG